MSTATHPGRRESCRGTCNRPRRPSGRASRRVPRTPTQRILRCWRRTAPEVERPRAHTWPPVLRSVRSGRTAALRLVRSMMYLPGSEVATTIIVPAGATLFSFLFCRWSSITRLFCTTVNGTALMLSRGLVLVIHGRVRAFPLSRASQCGTAISRSSTSVGLCRGTVYLGVCKS